MPSEKAARVHRQREGLLIVATLLLVAVLIYLAELLPALAQGGLTISSPLISISTEPRTISIPLKIQNLLDRPQVVYFNVSCPSG